MKLNIHHKRQRKTMQDKIRHVSNIENDEQRAIQRTLDFVEASLGICEQNITYQLKDRENRGQSRRDTRHRARRRRL